MRPTSRSSTRETTAVTESVGNEDLFCTTAPLSARRSLFDRWRGWRGIMFRSVLTTALGLALNVALLIYSGRLYDAEKQEAVLYTGECGTVSTANTIAHVGVNVLATLLVSAASNTINYLTAPSRADLDRLHASGIGAEVGVWDLRNWKVMSLLRKVLFSCAILSCVPLHLLYNSIITTTYVADDWSGFAVPESFLNDTQWDKSFLSATWSEAVSALSKIRDNATSNSMQRFELDACKHILQASLISNCSTVLFITTSNTQSGSSQDGPSMYVRHDSVNNRDFWTVASSYSLSNVSQLTLDHSNWMDSWNNATAIGKAYGQIADGLSTVQYCLFQPQPEQCTIQLVPQLIGPVVFFNILGGLAGSVLLFRKSFEPIATLGDAISSFLTRSCHHSIAKSLTDLRRGQVPTISSNAMTNIPTNFPLQRVIHAVWPLSRFDSKKQIDATDDLHWHLSVTRWYSAVSKGRWVWTSTFFALYWLSGLIGAAVVLSRSQNLSFALSQGIRSPLPPSSTSPSLIINFDNALANIVLANVFHLMLAINYLFYQNILARMALAAEFSRFVTHHRSLRVSNPVGKQESGYWFSIPHRLALGLLAISALLHFLVSEAIFYEQLHPRNTISPQVNSSIRSGTSTIHAVICNPEALLVFEGVGLIAPAAAFTYGWLRRLNPAAPLVTGDSRVLAMLSTHRKEVSGLLEALEPLQWGVIEQTREGGYVGFSSRTVQPLLDDRIYLLR